MQAEAMDAVVDRFYEAAVLPELWRPVLNELAEIANAQGVQMLHHRPEGAVLHTASQGLDHVLEAFFREGWNKNNPREVRARERGVALNELVTDRDLYTTEELDHEPWQKNFLDRFGLRWFCSFSLRMVLEPDPFYMSIERLAKSEPFSDAEVAQLARVLPHLRRAVRMTTALGEARQSGMLDAFNALQKPAFILGGDGRVVQMNAAGEVLLARDIGIVAGRLVAKTKTSDIELQRLIADLCASNQSARGSPMDAVALSRSGNRPLIVHGLPLVNSARDLFQQGRILLLLDQLTSPAALEDSILRHVFLLTAAELQIARILAEGASLTGAAALTRVAQSTAKSHLKAIFRKTNTHSQSELLVLLQRVSRPTGPIIA